MSDIEGSGWLAFVSDNGKVIGVGKHEGTEYKPRDGVALAVLAAPVTLRDWMVLLHDNPNTEAAVDRALEQYGGERIHRVIDLQRATVFHENIFQPVPEA
jgi:hypothetical protein